MPRVPLLVISLFFLAGSVAHFVITDFFVQSMPAYLGYHKELVLISGIFEFLGAIGILIPQTRLYAGYGLMALVIAVYPANINMALHPEQYDISPIFSYVRLPFQFLFLWFIWWAIAPERLRSKGSIQHAQSE